MSEEFEKREGKRLLHGLENGTLVSADAFNLAEKRDPVLVYLILKYLREKHPTSGGRATGVATRVLELLSTYESIVKMAKKGEKDPISTWFNETYSTRDFYNDPDGFVDLIVEKLEG